MGLFGTFWNMLASGNMLAIWLVLFVVAGLVFGILNGFFKARKIQPKGFRWKTFRNEAIFAVITITVSAFVLGYISTTLTKYGLISISHEPAAWWVTALEYAVYFLAFDTYFYWFHRLMHVEPMYKYVHKLHHYSTSPNLLTTLSVSPLELIINGGFLPLFLMLMPIHNSTMALIGPTNIFMGLYVHAGYEFLPRFWNKTWATRWFITTTFHDHHHKYFNFNFGGYTTIWDHICGTVRPKYDADWDKLKDRASASARTPAPVTAMEGGQTAT